MQLTKKHVLITFTILAIIGSVTIVSGKQNITELWDRVWKVESPPIELIFEINELQIPPTGTNPPEEYLVDISKYKTLYVYYKNNDPSFVYCTLSFEVNGGTMPNSYWGGVTDAHPYPTAVEVKAPNLIVKLINNKETLSPPISVAIYGTTH